MKASTHLPKPTSTAWNRPHPARGSVLPMVGVVVVGIGIYAITAPQISGSIAEQQAMMDIERSMVTTAIAALEMGRSQSFYSDANNFLSKLNTNITLPSGYNPWNGYGVEVRIVDNDDGDNDLNRDADYTLQMVARVYLGPSENPTRQVRVARNIQLSRASKYNFAARNFRGATVDAAIGSRDWFGTVHMSSDGGTPANNNDDYIWHFGGIQYFHGKLESLTFNNSHQPDSSWDFVKQSHYSNGLLVRDSFYTNAEVAALGLHTHRSSQSALLQTVGRVPTSQDIVGDLSAGGFIYKAADQNGTIIGTPTAKQNIEIFLAPNGQIWKRPFGGTPGMKSGANPNGWEVIGNQEGATVLVNGNVTLRGFVTGQTVIASTGSILINGNIKNTDFGHAHLGIVAGDNIYFENRRVAASDGTQTNQILGARPKGTSTVGAGGPAHAGRGDAATDDNGNNISGRAIDPATFNFVAKPVFDASQWNGTSLSSGLMGSLTAEQQAMVNSTTRMYQGVVTWPGDAESNILPGRMPRYGAAVEASMAAGWFISPAVTYYDENSSNFEIGNNRNRIDYKWRIKSEGGEFRIAGTYLLGTGIDFMATWSGTPWNGNSAGTSGSYGSVGKMIYDVHPNQVLTAPANFVTLRDTYPVVTYGSWRRLE